MFQQFSTQQCIMHMHGRCTIITIINYYYNYYIKKLFIIKKKIVFISGKN